MTSQSWLLTAPDDLMDHRDCLLTVTEREDTLQYGRFTITWKKVDSVHSIVNVVVLLGEAVNTEVVFLLAVHNWTRDTYNEHVLEMVSPGEGKAQFAIPTGSNIWVYPCV